MAAKLEISQINWLRLQRALKRKGRGRRESGAFLLAPPDSTRVKRFIAYDDLDPHCLDTGIIRFDGAGYVQLWDLCGKTGLRVIADVHTHPTDWTDQSPVDISNPMIPRAGHIALIMPEYAGRILLGIKGVGIHEYEGEGKWRKRAKTPGFFKITLL
jgi:proteasome lid subunit RPN8/RPN11